RGTNSPKSRLHQHDNLTNPFDNSSKDNDSTHKLSNENENRTSKSPTYSNGLSSTTSTNGSNSRPNSSSSSSGFSLRPKKPS
ncbi:unnamed protein product, partial [Rotaria magnacalcarata]